MNYFTAELHCHTLHSDGTFTLEQLCQSAKNAELDIIASTDHNTQSAQFELTASLQTKTLPVICGIEWTTYFGHMLVLGAKEFVDWRYVTPETIDEYIAKVKKAGGLVGLAHPFDLGSPMCTGGHWDFKVNDWSQVDYIEVWHEDNPSVKTPNLRALEFWTELLDKSYHIAIVYGKDWHGIWEENMQDAYTLLGVEDDFITPKNALKSINDGRTAITLGPKFIMQLSDENSVYYIGDTINKGKYKLSLLIDENARHKQWKKFNIVPQEVRLVGNGGTVLWQSDYKGGEIKTELQLNSGWIRSELWGIANGQKCSLAITGAIYINN